MLSGDFLWGVVKLLFSMFLSYPLAGILKRLPEAQTWKKNLFIIA